MSNKKITYDQVSSQGSSNGQVLTSNGSAVIWSTGGGGGGAGSAGNNTGVATYTKGGRGLVSGITGVNMPYAGGGCGGAATSAGQSNNVYDTVNPPGGWTPTSGTSIFYGG